MYKFFVSLTVAAPGPVADGTWQQCILLAVSHIFTRWWKPLQEIPSLEATSSEMQACLSLLLTQSSGTVGSLQGAPSSSVGFVHVPFDAGRHLCRTRAPRNAQRTKDATHGFFKAASDGPAHFCLLVLEYGRQKTTSCSCLPSSYVLRGAGVGADA